MLKGVRRAVRRGPNRTGDVRDTVGKFEVGGGGFIFFGGVVREKGGSGEPLEPPPLVTGLNLLCMIPLRWIVLFCPPSFGLVNCGIAPVHFLVPL